MTRERGGACAQRPRSLRRNCAGADGRRRGGSTPGRPRASGRRGSGAQRTRLSLRRPPPPPPTAVAQSPSSTRWGPTKTFPLIYQLHLLGSGFGLGLGLVLSLGPAVGGLPTHHNNPERGKLPLPPFTTPSPLPGAQPRSAAERASLPATEPKPGRPKPLRTVGCERASAPMLQWLPSQRRPPLPCCTCPCSEMNVTGRATAHVWRNPAVVLSHGKSFVLHSNRTAPRDSLSCFRGNVLSGSGTRRAYGEPIEAVS
eukprot:scaffold1501_cov331-Prasinococcus_capsulatus_cf.AAC.4